MNTTTDGTQLSPCVKLFIELLLDGASAVTPIEVAIARQPQDVVAHFRTGLPPNALVPEKVDERFAASCRQWPRGAVEMESIEKGEGEPFDNGCNLSSEGEVRRPQRRKYRAELHKQRLTTQFNGHAARAPSGAESNHSRDGSLSPCG